MKRKMRRGNRPYCEEISVKKNRLEPLRPDKSTIIRKEVIDEIKDGLQLWIRFQENQAASVEASVRRLNGLHSFSKQVEDNGCSGILLFTAIESLEAAKTSLEKNTLIEEVDYMGIRSKTAKVSLYHSYFGLFQLSKFLSGHLRAQKP